MEPNKRLRSKTLYAILYFRSIISLPCVDLKYIHNFIASRKLLHLYKLQVVILRTIKVSVVIRQSEIAHEIYIQF